MTIYYRHKGCALFVVAVALFTLPCSNLCAQEWKVDPASGNWNTASNWTPATVPNSSTATAIFDVSLFTSLAISANTQVSGILFDGGVMNPYTITASPTFTMTISGVGISNISGITQIFVAAAGPVFTFGEINFKNSATAGSSTTITNAGFTQFHDMSNAGSATINNPGAGFGATASVLDLFDSSTAGNATINNAGSTSTGLAGVTNFHNASTAASATINNAGSSGFGNSATKFFDTSTAGNATINNAVGSSGGNGGVTEFRNTSTAGNATINNTGGAGFGGTTEFHDKSTAGSATVTNSGASAGGGAFGTAFGGSTIFFDSSSAANSTFVNTGATVDHGFGGGTSFSGSSTAANGTFTNEGGTASFAQGGETGFAGTSTADAATLIAMGGANGGQPGEIGFSADSTGGTSRVELSGGVLNIGGHNAPGLTIGSLEGNGDGRVFLGGNNLSVGSNNLSTTFAGQIQDGGPFNTATGGSLTKIGNGALTLSGTNSYTGVTAVNGGKLVVDGSIASSSGVAVAAGATLAGHVNVSAISGAGAIAPGNSPGILTATHIDPSTGMSFAFDFAQAGSPTYSNAAASGNSVLRLTDATPFTMALNSANKITIDFSAASLAAGELFRGGFFTDTPTATSMVSGANFLYTGTGGFTVNFDGFVTEPIAEFGTPPGGVPGGTVLEFDISGTGTSVPDLGSSVLLFVLALAGLALFHRALGLQNVKAGVNGRQAARLSQGN